jgi:hypothetical protein
VFWGGCVSQGFFLDEFIIDEKSPTWVRRTWFDGIIPSMNLHRLIGFSCQAGATHF